MSITFLIRATAADKHKTNNQLVLEVEESDLNDEIVEVPVQVLVLQKENKPSGNHKMHTNYETPPKQCRNNHSAGCMK